MNQPTTINVVQNDFGQQIDFDLQNTDGTAFDMTGCTAVINAQAANSSGLLFTHPLTVNSPSTAGIVAYSVVSGDFPDSGKVNATIVVTNASSGAITSFPNITFLVQKAIPTF